MVSSAPHTTLSAARPKFSRVLVIGPWITMEKMRKRRRFLPLPENKKNVVTSTVRSLVVIRLNSDVVITVNTVIGEI